MTPRTRRAGESGQSSVELGGMLFWLLITAVFAWQLALVGWTAVSAANAARTASRMASRGGDGHAAGLQSLSGKGLRGHAMVTMNGDLATVQVRIPLVVPGLAPLKLVITETADMPYTG